MDVSSADAVPDDGHRRQVVRLLLALALTLLGFVWVVPYAGYAFSFVFFAPALVLEWLAFATARARGQKILVLIFLLMTGAGFALSAISIVLYASRAGRSPLQFLYLVVVTVALSLVAAFVGRRKRR